MLEHVLLSRHTDTLSSILLIYILSCTLSLSIYLSLSLFLFLYLYLLSSFFTPPCISSHLHTSNHTSPKDSSTLGHLQWIVRHSCTAAWSRSRCHSEGQRRSHACSRCCCQRTLEHPCCSHGARGRRCTLNWTLQMYLCLFIYQVFSLHLLYFG